MSDYRVVPNWCNCHPETCCCNDWAIVTNRDTKHSTHFDQTQAINIAEALNILYRPSNFQDVYK
jgi:hypothetical protein